MYAQVSTVAFSGIEAKRVDVQVQITPGLPSFTIVGLADKAVAESRERVRGALAAIGLALPPKRITVNLAPADLPKEGSHYDLPVALGLMAACGAIATDALAGYCVIGELSLDGSIAAVAGALPAAIGANAMGKGLICPEACGAEAAWAGDDMALLAPSGLLALVNHFKGLQTMARPSPAVQGEPDALPDMAEHALALNMSFENLVMIPLVLLARFISVAGAVALLRPFRNFTQGAIRVMTWGGVRGGISVALALSLPESNAKPAILTATYVVVIFSVVVQGLTIEPLIKRVVPAEDVPERHGH